MSQPAIRVEGLSKRYRINARQVKTRTLKDYLRKVLSSPWQYLATTLRPASEEEILWALRDITFEIEPGEVVGVIGPNGAGKSTLLKILSRITEPTEGRACLRGRVSSLLEVGTGFHRELSGRDNVYLNGAILGMTQREIGLKFNDIVAFSGLEKFMETPVKRYSSGMYMRLAFAVAAHLDPEILLVDEVLAVGDAEFRKKCLGKMGDVAKSGRTILFVSHNMGAIKDLCPRCLWIDQGRIVRFGPSAEVVRAYLETFEETGTQARRILPGKPGTDFQILEVRLLNAAGQEASHHDCDEAVLIELLCYLKQPVNGLTGSLEFSAADGTRVLFSDSRDDPPNALDNLPVGRSVLTITLPRRTLGAGRYQIFSYFTSEAGFTVDSPGFLASLEIEDHKTWRGNDRQGFFSTLLPWEIHGETERELGDGSQGC